MADDEDVDVAIDMVAEYVNAKGAELREVYEQGVDDGAELQAAGPQSAEQQCRALSRKVLSRKPSGRRAHSRRGRAAGRQAAGSAAARRSAKPPDRRILSRGALSCEPLSQGSAPTGR